MRSRAPGWRCLIRFTFSNTTMLLETLPNSEGLWYSPKYSKLIEYIWFFLFIPSILEFNLHSQIVLSPYKRAVLLCIVHYGICICNVLHQRNIIWCKETFYTSILSTSNPIWEKSLPESIKKSTQSHRLLFTLKWVLSTIAGHGKINIWKCQ